MISPEQTEMFHHAILRVLEENNTRFGLGAIALSLLVGRYGFTPNSQEIQRATDYLSDPAIGFIAPVQRGDFHPENGTWKITAKGTNHLSLQRQPGT